MALKSSGFFLCFDINGEHRSPSEWEPKSHSFLVWGHHCTNSCGHGTSVQTVRTRKELASSEESPPHRCWHPREEMPEPRPGMARGQRSLPLGSVPAASAGTLLQSTPGGAPGSSGAPWPPASFLRFFLLQSGEGGRDAVGKRGRQQVTITAKPLGHTSTFTRGGEAEGGSRPSPALALLQRYSVKPME